MSRDFDGSTGYLTLPVTAVLRPSLPVTISAWINPDTIAAGDGIFTNNRTDATYRGFFFYFNTSGGIVTCGYGNNGGSASSNRRSKISSSTISTGAWQHVACCIRGAGDMDIYIAGVDDGGTYSGSGGAMAYNTSVGGRIGNVAGTLFDGRIAEVGLWTVTLAAAEILALAKGTSPARIRPGSLLGYWPIYGAASPEIDLSANNNPGTLTGTAPLANHSPVGCPFPAAA